MLAIAYVYIVDRQLHRDYSDWRGLSELVSLFVHLAVWHLIDDWTD